MFPSYPTECALLIRALGVSELMRVRIARNPRSFKIALWHFHARHCRRNTNGRWYLRKVSVCADDGQIMLGFVIVTPGYILT